MKHPLFKAAADLVTRKCDTIYYSLVLAGSVAYGFHSGEIFDAAVNKFALAVSNREIVRMFAWLIRPDPKVPLGPPAIIIVACALNCVCPLLTVVQKTQLLMQGSDQLIPIGILSTLAIPNGIAAAVYLKWHNLDAKKIFNLYQKHIFDYYDKLNPPKGPRFRDRLKDLAAKLLPQPRPTPA